MRSTVFSCFCVLSYITLCIASGTWPGWSNLSYLFVFGDSYTSIQYHLSTSPAPSTTNPLGLPAPGFPSSNGPNWLAYLVRTYNANRTVLTYDLAVSGATISRSLVPPPSQASNFKTLEDQIGDVVAAGDLGWGAGDSLWVVWIGVNDIRLGYQTAVGARGLVAGYFQQIQRLYDLGARNFLLLDIPDISGSPEGLLKTTADRRAFREFIDTYNRELHSQAERFRAENEVVLFNVFSPRIVAEEILDRPAAYGITNTTAACLSYHAYDGKEDWNTQYDPDCGAPVNEFFWRDNIHPTSIVHREWGRRLAGYLQTQGPQ